jgi:hypothetical protein
MTTDRQWKESLEMIKRRNKEAFCRMKEGLLSDEIIRQTTVQNLATVQPKKESVATARPRQSTKANVSDLGKARSGKALKLITKRS